MIQGFTVVPNGTANMIVLVQPGSARITTGTSPSDYGYFIFHDTSAGEPVTIATAAASPRNDYIVAYVDKSVAASTSPTYVNNTNNVVKFASVAGTPSGSPAVPTTSQITTAIGASNPYIILAKVAVAASVTQITSANITDLRNLIAPSIFSNAWTAWTPTFSASGGMTFASTTVNYAKFQKIGKTVSFQLSVTGVFGGSADSEFYFTLPVASSTAFNTFAASFTDTAGSVTVAAASFQVSATQARVRRYDAANFSGLGQSQTLRCSGSYETA